MLSLSLIYSCDSQEKKTVKTYDILTYRHHKTYGDSAPLQRDTSLYPSPADSAHYKMAAERFLHFAIRYDSFWKGNIEPISFQVLDENFVDVRIKLDKELIERTEGRMNENILIGRKEALERYNNLGKQEPSKGGLSWTIDSLRKQ
ncbi:MAG TPA: hypothetical protein VMR70_11510 [Flavisolibacter sp.]|nr:hypothetical protein [Flavisolibacter sp.]